MEVSMIFVLAKSFGVGGVFLWAAFYMLKRNEAHAAQQRSQAN
jgi:hypothetical protein